MSTRSTITFINPDKTAEQVFCHWDGYLAFNGLMLQTAYRAPQKAKDLVSHGDMDHLGYTSKQSHMQKAVNLLNNFDAFKLASKLGYNPYNMDSDDIVYKLHREIERFDNPYTLYFNRDCGNNDPGAEPVRFKEKDVKMALKNAYDNNGINTRHIKEALKHDRQCIIMPAEEYNYIYNDSLKLPQWYVTYTNYDGVFTYSSLQEALNNDENEFADSSTLQSIVNGYHDFLKHPYNPTYSQFMSMLKRKYDKSHSKSTTKRKTKRIPAEQMSLF